ncbi:GatB/YqeY domain-containing protein [Aneurinibacillus sp. Ricciae_BoGa-3]|uniref:GatB/YqeY domain-containing protein n=1 Tax=Aneurinibacillus sp. Ricciae_BoGa-3 TaxID=3022697 RepID=UPI0023408B58|nr:GatB/YqeY domain-containing protein [Aneurinibacillus sp. Ricciae_BoGa-3]WCK53470.1 GatB/YqeY domain-containing protein [Aneurinibacillus sp. Ricciae_BoGa-3]
MKLVERLNEEMKQAMKSKDKLKLSVIRMVKSSVKNEEINQGKELTDDEVLTVLTRELKQRRDSLQEFEKAGREDLAAHARDEINVLIEYMPEQLDEEEIRKLVSEAIQQSGASSKKDMGKVMGALMPKVKGRADGSLVNKIVQELLPQ